VNLAALTLRGGAIIDHVQTQAADKSATAFRSRSVCNRVEHPQHHYDHADDRKGVASSRPWRGRRHGRRELRARLLGMWRVLGP
jgi:hypothetical protein